MYKNLSDYAESVNTICNNGFDKESMTMNSEGTKYRYSNNSLTPFPTSENYGYAMALHNGNDKYYYIDLPRSDFYSQSVSDYYANAVSSTTEEVDPIGHYFYPKFTLAMCGKNYFKQNDYQSKHKDYSDQLEKLEAVGDNDSLKLNLITKLVNFQYSLYNDWGYLSMLGLPITKLFTEIAGGLYENKSDEVLNELDKQIEESDGSQGVIHKIMSAIPYFMVPGASDVYNVSKNSFNSVGSVLGNIPFVGGFLNSGVKVAGNIAAIGLSYASAKVILLLLPIVGILILGILRFALIIAKIFSLHLSALFILPIAIARENVESIKNFAMKLLATMLELPLFVAGIYLALFLNGLIKALGGYFGKTVIVGMLSNADASNDLATAGMENWINTTGEYGGKLTVYILDGIVQIAVAAISIAVVYKIIITLHNTILEIIEIKGMQRLDDAADAIRNDASSLGSKI